MAQINILNRDYICLSTAEQSIKPFTHNPIFIFSNLDDVWACLWKQLLLCICLLLLKHEVQLNSEGLKRGIKIYAIGLLASTLQIATTILLVPHRTKKGWTLSVPAKAPGGVLGTKTWTKIPCILWNQSITWVTKSSSLQLSSQKCKIVYA